MIEAALVVSAEARGDAAGRQAVVAKIVADAFIAEEGRAMSCDDRFDGKKVYEVGVAGVAIYDIRSNRLHEAEMTSQPKYEIRGNHIREYMSASQPKFEIKGDKIHPYMSAASAIYEIR